MHTPLVAAIVVAILGTIIPLLWKKDWRAALIAHFLLIVVTYDLYQMQEKGYKGTIVWAESLPNKTNWEVLSKTQQHHGYYSLIKDTDTENIICAFFVKELPQKFTVIKSGIWKWKKTQFISLPQEKS